MLKKKAMAAQLGKSDPWISMVFKCVKMHLNTIFEMWHNCEKGLITWDTTCYVKDHGQIHLSFHFSKQKCKKWPKYENIEETDGNPN